MDEKTVSRRQAVGLVGLGLASAAGGVSMAQQETPQSVAKDDPRTKYPKPPFQQQTQPWPGLAGKMTPKRSGPANCSRSL